jgi:hypothetical protein
MKLKLALDKILVKKCLIMSNGFFHNSYRRFIKDQILYKAHAFGRISVVNKFNSKIVTLNYRIDIFCGNFYLLRTG